MTNDDFDLGDRVRWGRHQEGVVIGVIERGAYRDPGAAHRWKALTRGVLVQSADGEVHHFRDAGTSLQKG